MHPIKLPTPPLKLPPDIIERLPKRLPKIEKLEEVPRYLEEQGLLLDDLNVRIQQLLELTQTMLNQMQRVPEGLIFPIEKTIEGAAVTKLEIIKDPECGEKPWYSCTIYNDGDSDLYVSLNFPHKKYQRVESGEALDLDMHAPIIRTLYLKSVVGGSCDIRIVGER